MTAGGIAGAAPDGRELDVNERAKRGLEEAAAWMSRDEPIQAQTCLDGVVALDAGAAAPELSLVIGARLMLATLAEKQGKFDKARARLKDAEERLPADAPDELRLAVLGQKLGWLHMHGELREASVVAEELLTLAELRRVPEWISRFSQESGMLLYKLGDLDAAESRAARAASAAAEAKTRTEFAQARKLQGNIASGRGQAKRALALYDEALDIFLAAGNEHEAANCHYNAAGILRATGEREAMRARLDEAVILFTKAGSLGGVGLCRMLEGEGWLRDGDFLRAEERLREAARIFERERNRHRLGQTKQFLAELASARGDKTGAADLAREAGGLLGPGSR